MIPKYTASKKHMISYIRCQIEQYINRLQDVNIEYTTGILDDNCLNVIGLCMLIRNNIKLDGSRFQEAPKREFHVVFYNSRRNGDITPIHANSGSYVGPLSSRYW